MKPSDPGSWEELARTQFKVPGLRPFQKEVIAALVSPGKPRILAVMPTGSGKSLCFTLPALVHPGPSLVIYPLKALMQDQMRRFRALGLPCGILQGGQTRAQREAIFSSLKQGLLRFLVANPEVLQQSRIRKVLEEISWSQVILDEVHCVATWGEAFRPAYLALRTVLDRLDYRVLAGFTATAGPEVRARIQDLIFTPEPAREMICDPDRPNIHYFRWLTQGRLWALETALLGYPRPALVFCRTREATRMVAVHLARVMENIPVRFFHAGLTREEKFALQEWFLSSETGVLCTTKAFGMGVDKPDVRTVIHWDLPESLEDFLQESGRGGRDGHPSWSLVLEEKSSAAGCRAFQELCSTPGCLRKGLLGTLGWKGDSCGACGPCLGIHLPEGPPGAQDLQKENSHTRAHILWGRRTPKLSWWVPLVHPSWGTAAHSSLEALEDLKFQELPEKMEKSPRPALLFSRIRFFFTNFLAKPVRKG